MDTFSALDAQTRTDIQELFLHVRDRTQQTVLFVTHDIAEAVIMADRIVVFSSRPGSIQAVVDVPFPRPRDAYELPSAPEFAEIFGQVSALLRGTGGLGQRTGRRAQEIAEEVSTRRR